MVGREVAEFAKSVFLRGRMVSAIPVNALEFDPKTFLGNIVSVLKYVYFADIPVTPIQISRLYNERSQNRMLRVIMNPLLPYYVDMDSFYPNRHLEAMVEQSIINQWTSSLLKEEFRSRNIDWIDDKLDEFGPNLGALYRRVQLDTQFSNFFIWRSKLLHLKTKRDLCKEDLLEEASIKLGDRFVMYDPTF